MASPQRDASSAEDGWDGVGVHVAQEAADGDDVHEQFQRYCDSMAGSAVWGGQAELGALAHVLRRRIDVFSVGMPTVAMGEEYTGSPLVTLAIIQLWMTVR